jgi:ketosteroid isomerase-like protein
MAATDIATTADPVVDKLLALERERCIAVAASDLIALRRLLAPELVHVHTRGNQDTLESYLHYMSHTIQVLKVERRDLKVALYDNCAVMTGGQTSVARLRNSDHPEVHVETQVMQVWVKKHDAWQLVAFQATLTGPPPPAIPR